MSIKEVFIFVVSGFAGQELDIYFTQSIDVWAFLITATDCRSFVIRSSLDIYMSPLYEDSQLLPVLLSRAGTGSLRGCP